MKNVIMFVHGMFLNPKSWEHWQDFFDAKGYYCVAPAWPLHDGEPEYLRENVPDGLGELSLDAVISTMKAEAAAYDNPILVGHSVGGLVVQKLIAQGIGRLGVCICSAAPNRMLSLDWGFFRNSAVITNPLKGDEPYPMDGGRFFNNFGNTMSRVASERAYLQYTMPESRNVLRDCLGESGRIDLDQPHAPLLFIAAEKDEIIPAELCEKNSKAYTDLGSRSEYKEFRNRGHFICGQPGWESVASYVDAWIRRMISAARADVEALDIPRFAGYPQQVGIFRQQDGVNAGWHR